MRYREAPHALAVSVGKIDMAAAISMAKSALQRRPGRFAERARQEDGLPRAPKAPAGRLGH